MAPSALIAAGVTLERLVTGATWGEGPVWLPEQRVLRWSDIPGNRILEWVAADGSWRVHREDVEFTNGRARWRDGVVQCSHGRRAVEFEKDGEVNVLVDRFDGARLNSPNDIAVHPDGSLWFTDPPYGIVQPHEGHPGEQEYGGCYVFRFADGELTPIITDILRPNGLAFSPDTGTLYVTDTSSALGDGPDHCIRAYRLVGDGADTRAVDGHVLAVVEPGVPDGIAVDVEGRIWSSSASGVQVISPEGVVLERIDTPETVGNLCFGGHDNDELYIAASTSLYRIRTATRGLV